MNALVLVLALTVPGADALSARVIQLVNEERADADRRELEIYGFLQDGPRLPLDYDATLAESADWWCQGLKGTGILAHSWWVNDRGYLILSPTDPVVLNRRIWFPQSFGMTSWLDRNAYLGLDPISSSENGVLASGLNAETMFFLWLGHGYNKDPRLAFSHYSNLIRADWTHAGVAKGASGTTGRSYGFMEFANFGVPLDPLEAAWRDWKSWGKHGPKILKAK